MRAYLKDNDRSLDDKVELEDFLDGTIHKVQFQRLTREDQKSKLPKIQMQFNQHRIVGTLERLYEDVIKPSFSPNP